MCVGQDSEGVNTVVKYLLFFFNFIFWLIGCALIGLGAWAYIEKNRFYHNDIQSIYDILFDVSIGIIVVGCIIFIIAFAGCLGALRENIVLLKTFSYMLGILFLLEVVGAILIFVFSGQGKEEVTKLFREEGIVRYRDDPDFQSIFDWVQETFHCCGVGHKGYKEWSMNVYFNCSDTNPSATRCAVPFSCCKQPNDVSSDHKNLMCGYGVQKLDYLEATERVYIKGCVQAVIDEAKQNLYILGAAALALAIPQLIGIFLARILANDIEEILGPILACWFAFEIQDRHEHLRKVNFLRHAQNMVKAKKRNIIRYTKNLAVRPRKTRSSPDASAVVAIDYGHDLYGSDNPAANHHISELLDAPSEMKITPEKRIVHEEMMPVMNHHEPKKHPNPLALPPIARLADASVQNTDISHQVKKKCLKNSPALPPIARLASHSVRNSGLVRIERYTGKVHKTRPKRRILNPLNLPPVARAAGTDVVRVILARREKMKTIRKGVSIEVGDYRDEEMMDNDRLQLLDDNPQTPRRPSVEDIDAIEMKPKKTRIYPQRQLRDLCSASDIVNLNMSLLSSPTVQATPKGNIPEAINIQQSYPHLPQPSSTQVQGHNMAKVEVHSPADNVDAAGQGPRTSAREQEDPTSFAQMQKMLRDLLAPRRQQAGQLYWELPATTGNDSQEPLLIPRPDYNTADPPAANSIPHMTTYLPQVPVQQQQPFVQPFSSYPLPQYQAPPAVSMVPSIAQPGSMLSSVTFAPPVLTQPMPRVAQQPLNAHIIPGTSYVNYPLEFVRPRRPMRNAAYLGRTHRPLYSSEGLTRTYYY